MSLPEISLVSITAYLLAMAGQGMRASSQLKCPIGLIQLLIAIGLVAHLMLLKEQVLLPEGINLSLLQSASLVSCAVILITGLSSLRHPLHNVFLIVCPLGALTLLAAWLYPEPPHIHRIQSTPELIHILSSILSYALLMVSAFIAIITAAQDRTLKHHPTSRAVALLPPIQTMESLLFHFIAWGVLILTLALGSGWFFLDNLFAQHLAHKAILSHLAWIVFTLLLVGRYRYGWRGRRAIYWTISGFILLVLAYFGSKFVLECLLQR